MIEFSSSLRIGTINSVNDVMNTTEGRRNMERSNSAQNRIERTIHEIVNDLYSRKVSGSDELAYLVVRPKSQVRGIIP